MKYLCLAYYDEKRYEALPKAEMAAIVSQCAGFDRELHASGHLLGVASLAAPGKAVSVRPAGGRPSVTDGPYAETKEQLGSFFVIEAQDMEEAVRIASMHPAARIGGEIGWGVEVRGIEFECEAQRMFQ